MASQPSPGGAPLACCVEVWGGIVCLGLVPVAWLLTGGVAAEVLVGLMPGVAGLIGPAPWEAVPGCCVVVGLVVVAWALCTGAAPGVAPYAEVPVFFGECCMVVFVFLQLLPAVCFLVRSSFSDSVVSPALRFLVCWRGSGTVGGALDAAGNVSVCAPLDPAWLGIWVLRYRWKCGLGGDWVCGGTILY